MMSIEIAHGVDIHYRDKISYIFFADGRCKEYAFNHDLYSDFIDAEDRLFSKHRRKNSRKKKRINHEDLEVFNFKSFLEILFYCHWKLTQENKALKICLYCGRFFIPEHRRDTNGFRKWISLK